MSIYESFKKADEWIVSSCWLAVFDILGFSNLIDINKDNQQAFDVRVDYEETIKNLEKSCSEYSSGSLDYSWFSDTFLIYTSDDSAKSYVVIRYAAVTFIKECIRSRIPIRGAIAVGSLMHTEDKRSFIGAAFLEALKYGEDQDWIGLLITPNAAEKAKSYGLDPLRHDFVKSDDIPMRKLVGQNVLAYRFQNGAANFPSYLIPWLREMKSRSEKQYHSKYERTIKFIERYYQWIDKPPNPNH